MRVEGDGERGERWRKFVRDITTRSGWTVQRLADDSGLNRSTIFRWLNGTTKNLSIESVRLVADAAGVDLGTALRAASDLVAGTPARNADELSEDIQKVLDDAGLPDDDRLTIAQMLLDEYDRDEEERQRQRVERAKSTVETWKRARGA